MKRILLIAALCFAASAATASDFKIMPTARALFDLAAYAPSDSDFRAGVCIPDVRLGAKANFGNWEARADLSYRFGKLYPADIYIKYQIDKRSFLQGGYFVHQFGLQSATGASHKISMEQPLAETAFGEPRLLGVMYVHDWQKMHLAGSLFAQSETSVSHSSQLGRTGWGGMARYVWHPVARTGAVVQAGLTALAQTPSYTGNVENPIMRYAATFPTKVANVNCLKTSVDSVRAVIKLTPEVLLAKGRWAFEGQFYWMRDTRRHGLSAYDAIGFYALGRVLLGRGRAYSYSAAPAALATPGKGSWEIVAGYTWADMNDHRARIEGGRAQTATATLNYYINKWITWRLNCAWTHCRATPSLPERSEGIFQTRIQFVF